MTDVAQRPSAARARVLRPDGLRETEERFRTVFVQAALPQVLVELDTGLYVAFNDEFCSFLGYEQHELIGRGPRDVCMSDEFAVVEGMMARLRAGELDRLTLDRRFLRKDGGVRYARAYGRLIRDDEGRGRHAHVLLVDHTGERLAEQALAASEARLRALVEHSDDLLLLVSADGMVRHAGPNAQRLAPCTAGPDASLFDLVASSEAAALRECLTDVALHRGTRRLRARGDVCCERRHWDIRLQAAGQGAPLDGIVVTLRDVSAQARAEELAEGEAAILRMLLSGTAPDAVMTALARLLESLYPQLRATVLVVSPDGRSLRHGAAPSMPSEYVAAVDGMPVAMGSGMCGTAAFLGEPVVVEAVREDARLRDYWEILDRADVRSCWSLPILGPGGQVVGTFALYAGEQSRPDAEQWRVGQRLAYLTGLVIGQPFTPRAVASDVPTPQAQGLPAGLTPREREVLRLIGLGHTNAEIAPLLNVGVRTVESHRAALLRKLEASTRADLVRAALDAGLLTG